mmetsp:Transcript_18097/g.29356  ORF Transcript_18097/g.29356 Transcript_18097/m.29356 type:complete len:316 (-) Transcript_18097:1042-1989(-)
MKLIAFAGCGLLVAGEVAGEAYPAAFIETLQTRTNCENENEILKGLDFYDYVDRDPYPDYSKGGYNTDFDKEKNCYVSFTNPGARTSANETINYKLLSLSEQAARRMNGTTNAVYLTHQHECGVCSTLDQLGTYLMHEDLTSPVRACGIKGVIFGEKVNLDCLEGLTFKDACKYIWYYNTVNSKKNCGIPCALGIHTPSNVERQSLLSPNYCKPATHSRANWSTWSRKGKYCENTINGRPACERFQWTDNEYRLNSCLQCDECRSGPVFQKMAGRTRRNSGLESAIRRPPRQMANISHSYGIPYSGLRAGLMSIK